MKKYRHKPRQPKKPKKPKSAKQLKQEAWDKWGLERDRRNLELVRKAIGTLKNNSPIRGTDVHHKRLKATLKEVAFRTKGLMDEEFDYCVSFRPLFNEGNAIASNITSAMVDCGYWVEYGVLDAYVYLNPNSSDIKGGLS